MAMLDFPRLRQSKDYDCGAIVIQGVLEYYGFDVREDKIIKLAGTRKKATQVRNIARVLDKYGLKAKARKFTLSEVKKFISKGYPVILVLQAWTDKNKTKWENWTNINPKKDLVEVDWSDDWKDGHYVVAIGYDKNKMYFEDPGSVFKEYLTFDELMKRWHDVGGNKNKGKKYVHYGIVAIGKKVYDGRKTVKMG